MGVTIGRPMAVLPWVLLLVPAAALLVRTPVPRYAAVPPSVPSAVVSVATASRGSSRVGDARVSSNAPGAVQRATPPLRTYTVQDGDTLAGIAARFGTNVASLQAANNLQGSTLIYPGETLTVPEHVGWVWSVRSGQTLQGIASATGVSLTALASVNGLSTGSPLVAGQRLLIPQEPKSAEAPASGAVRATTWVVQPGNTLTGIAAAQGVSLQALEQANGLTNDSVLQVGQQLIIPTK
jgi:LysM repeat protein